MLVHSIIYHRLKRSCELLERAEVGAGTSEGGELLFRERALRARLVESAANEGISAF
jgi:hypothetical protein